MNVLERILRSTRRSPVAIRVPDPERPFESSPAAAASDRATTFARVKVCHRTSELPKHDSIISGTEKMAGVLVVFAKSDAERIVEIRDAQVASAIVSSELLGTAKARELFTHIRDRLAGSPIELRHTYWATSDLVLELSKQKKEVSRDDLRKFSEDQKNEYRTRFYSWLDYGIEENATDLHVEVHGNLARIRYRIHGELEPMRNQQDGEMVASIAQSTIAYAYLKLIDRKSNSSSHFSTTQSLSSTVTYRTGSVTVKMRCNLNPLANGFDFIARFTPDGASAPEYSFHDLGYAPSQVQLLEQSLIQMHGIIVIAGIPGSGKTTTARTCLRHLPSRPTLKVVAVDDPVEYFLEGVSHASIGGRLGDESERMKNYSMAVGNWVRGNPNVISLGEVRDAASGVAAITFAEVGCLTIGTVHAHSAPGIFQRLSDPAAGLSLHSLTAPRIINLLVYQALVPVLCPECCIPLAQMPEFTRSRYQAVGKRFSVDVGNLRFRNHRPECPACNGRGTSRQEVVAEMLKPDRKLLSLMRQGEDFEAEEYWLNTWDGRFDTPDMTGKTAFQHAFYKALQGLIDPSTVERFGLFDTYDIPSPKEHGERRKRLAR